MKPLFVSILILFLFLSGCDVIQHHKFRSYITSYYDCAELTLMITDDGNIVITGHSTIGIGSWDSKGREKQIYDSLCTLHNDMTYNKERSYIGYPDFGNSYKGDIVSVDVVSNADFNELYPANSSLNDIVRFLSRSIYPYILSGYKDTFDWDKDFPENFRVEKGLSFGNMDENPCYHPVDKRLSELTPSDLVLANTGYFNVQLGFLVFEQQPNVNKKHELTVTIKLSDGRVFTPKVAKIFK